MKKISYLALSSLIIIEIVSLNSGINLTLLKESSGIDSWIVIIISYIIGFIPLLLVLFIANYKKDLTINELIDKLFGKIFGKIINIFFAIILFVIAVTILHNINILTTSQFLYRTPIIISTILLILLSIYHTNKGITVISRVSQILMCINFTLFIISFFSLAKEINFDNYLPLLKTKTSTIIINSLKVASMNTLPLLTILVIPKNKITVPEKYNKALILSYLIGSAISIIVVAGTYGVLGPYLTKTFEYPEYMVLRKIKLFGFLERTENIVSIQWIIGSYIYITIIMYNISKCIKHNNEKGFKLINLIIGALLIIASQFIFTSTTLFNNYIRNIFPYITTLLLIIYLLIIPKILIDKRKV